MIKFVVGDIIESKADCLVNTVNCEGFMGKGIAYQFKLKYPQNEKYYIQACRSGKMKIGVPLLFKDEDKIIINFPTKDRWRENSQYSYIEQGMDSLVHLIQIHKIQSIAIPPLGCGNGGLDWIKVKDIIKTRVNFLADIMDIYIYEPSHYYKTTPKTLPKLTASHLVLMRVKSLLTKFTKIRIQKAGFFINLFSDSDYFKFDEYKFGPYSHSIDILSKQIRSYQEYYRATTTEAEKIAYTSLISSNVQRTIENYQLSILKASAFTNSIKSDTELEIVSTLLYIIKAHPEFSTNQIIEYFFKWPKDSINRFTELDLHSTLQILEKSKIIEKTLYSFSFNDSLITSSSMPTYNKD